MTDTDTGGNPEPLQPVQVEPTSAPGPSSAAEPAVTGADEHRVDGSGGSEGTDGSAAGQAGDTGEGSGPRPRRRGSRGGRGRTRPRPEGAEDSDDDAESDAEADVVIAATAGASAERTPALPDRQRTSKPATKPTETAEVAEVAEVAEASPARKPRIGDSRPAPAEEAGSDEPAADAGAEATDGQAPAGQRKRRRRGGRGRGGSGGGSGSGSGSGPASSGPGTGSARSGGSGGQGAGQGGGSGGQAGNKGKPRAPRATVKPVTAVTDEAPLDIDEETLSSRRGRERKGRPVGRYLMAVHVQPEATQIAVLEGRSLIEHYVSRPTDAVAQIHGNIYLGKVQNVLPGMEAAFVDIGTPKNAVLYRGDTRYDPEDLDNKGQDLRIEQILKARQTILCQVTKNPIGAKGARLTQEVSLPGRFVVLVPNSTTYGISKRLPDNERKRLRQILDKAKPDGHGLIVRTAAEGISAEELQRDVARLAGQWAAIEALAAKTQAPALLYQEPDMALRVIREEFNQDYRQVVIDDDTLFGEVRDYVRSISPALVERVERYDPAEHGGLPIYETHHVHEQLHKALDRKVWLPSGGSLIIERTEALTVIDVNTGKNVGKSSLEETVFRNNLEAAEEVAHQLRLRDIGGIIVIDFIDMEIRANREKVIATFRQALSRDKTRTQVFDISELGLVEMTRKRIGEGLIESLSTGCPTCDSRGFVFDQGLIGS